MVRGAQVHSAWSGVLRCMVRGAQVHGQGCSSAWCMVGAGVLRCMVHGAWVLRGLLSIADIGLGAAFMLEFARGMAYSMRRVDSHYGPRACGSPPIPSR